MVPFEEIVDLTTDPDGRRLLAAFASHGCTELVCFTVDDMTPTRPEHSAVPNQAVVAPIAGVQEWLSEMFWCDTVLASPELDAAVLVSVDDFILVGGNREFVETALGMPVEDARAEFATYAQEAAKGARHLPGVARKWGAS